MESISAVNTPDASSKPLGVGSMSHYPEHSEGSLSSDHLATSRKRKPDANDNIYDSNVDTTPASEMETRNGTLKKPRLHSPPGPLTPTQVYIAPKDKSRLPREIWNHICLFVPPRALGNLLRVNKLFNTYLDPKTRFVMLKQPPPLTQSRARLMDPHNVWRRARRAFWPKTPGPFKDMTELDMWRLTCSTTCQFCGKKDSRQQLPLSDPYRHGPGVDGVALIWEFRVRTCGACFSRKTIKEMDIILSTASTFFLPALPFVIANEGNIVIPLHVIETGKLSPTKTLSKLFWSPDVECLREEFLSVKELGPAAASEWQKGLSLRGSKRFAEAAKWQKYEDSGGVTDMRTFLQHNNARPKVASAEHATVVPAKTALQVAKAETPKTILTAPSPTLGKTVIANSAPVTAEKTKEEIDAEWDEIQGPVRLKILKYADEAITGDWDDGEKVNKKNAPSFAADVLLHVRKRFYTEVENEAKAARAAGQDPVVDPPEGPFTQKLSLENMKYVFDNKIKPITGNLCKELFLCNNCGYNGKFFGLEGVIQHFASKHTTILSKGNIVVAWRAEWPEYSPFKATLRRPKGAAQPTLPAKPPSSRSAKSVPVRHDSRGSSQGHMPENTRHPQPAQPPLHPTALLTAQSIAAPVHGQPQYYSARTHAPQFPEMPLPQPSSYLERGLREYISAPYSQHSSHSSQTQVEPEAYRGYSEPAYQRDSHLAHANSSVSYGIDQVPTSADGALPSDVRTPGLAYESRDPTARVPDGPSATPDVDTEAKLNEIAKHASHLWKATESMRSVPAAVRRYTVHFHLSNIYEDRFGQPLPLALFIKALMTREEMQPMKAGVRLPCKACQFSLGREWTARIREDTYSTIELYNHFENTHVSNTKDGKPKPNSLDWLTDMLLLPTPKAMSAMAGKRGRTFPLLSQTLQGQSSLNNGGRPATKKIIYKDRVKYWTESLPQRGDTKTTRRERQSSVVIKREESPGPDSTVVRPPQVNVSTTAVLDGGGRDILGALEMHLNHVPPEHKSAIQDDGLRFADEERERAGYDRYGDAQHRHSVVSPEYHIGARGAAARGQPQADRVKVHIAQSGERYFPAVPNHASQYREHMLPPTRNEQYGTAYGYDDSDPQQYSQPQQTLAHLPPPQVPQNHTRAPRDDGYRGRYAEQEAQPLSARAEYEPHETYEVVRVVHPEGDYLVQRPVRRQVFQVAEPGPAHQYYRQAAQPMYGDVGGVSAGQPPHRHEYYAEPTAYGRARPSTNMAYETSRERIVAAPSRPTRESNIAQQTEAYYGGYDPHYPTATAGHQYGRQQPMDGANH